MHFFQSKASVLLFPLLVLLLTVPGTENSESNEDAQEQLWDDKKVLTGKGRANKMDTFYVNHVRFTAHYYVLSSG